MKPLLIGLAFILFAGCARQQNTAFDAALESKVASLQKQADDSKPGLGEIMGVIEQHHAKLYYAGAKQNWPLASYELNEIQESLEDAMKLYPTPFNNVTVALPQIIPSMTRGTIAGVRDAIEQKNEKSFVSAYEALSNSCSSCHAAENHPFIKITTPVPGMFSDQDFAPSRSTGN